MCDPIRGVRCAPNARQRQSHTTHTEKRTRRNAARSASAHPRAPSHAGAQYNFTLAFSRLDDGAPLPRTTTADYDGGREMRACPIVGSARSARFGSARRARHVRGRNRENGLSTHLPQRGPTAAGTGEFTIFGPKIVEASTKAVFQQWWPSTQRASPSCAGPTPSGGGATHVSVSRASRRATTQHDATRRNMTGAAECDPD